MENPDLNNREIANQIGVTEATIRYWKKQSFWEEERQKFMDEMAEEIGLRDEQQREEFRESLRKQQQHLEILREQIHGNTIRALNIANRVYAQASMMNDPLKACGMLTKAGAHTQAKQALEGIKAIMAIDEHLYQFDLLIDYMDNQDDDDDA